MLVALAGHLLGARQQRLDLAEVDEAVAVVGLLDDARDHVADAVLVLVEHHLALRLADPLEDHLLGGLCGDAAEVGRRHVDHVDVGLGQPVPVELGLGLLDRYLLAVLVRGRGGRRLLTLLRRLGQVQEALLDQDLVRDADLEHAHVARVAVDLDAHVAGRLRRLLVRRLEGVLERDEEHLRVDRLLPLQLVDGVEDLFAHSVTGFQTMFDRETSPRGSSSSAPSSRTRCSDASSAAVRRPRKLRCPDRGCFRRICTVSPSARV